MVCALVNRKDEVGTVIALDVFYCRSCRCGILKAIIKSDIQTLFLAIFLFKLICGIIRFKVTVPRGDEACGINNLFFCRRIMKEHCLLSIISNEKATEIFVTKVKKKDDKFGTSPLSQIWSKGFGNVWCDGRKIERIIIWIIIK